jgi:hypothetical protein
VRRSRSIRHPSLEEPSVDEIAEYDVGLCSDQDRELVTAAPGPDRRVKLLALTARGRRVRSELERRIARNSPAMTRLTKTERRMLLQLLDRLISREPETRP